MLFISEAIENLLSNIYKEYILKMIKTNKAYMTTR